MGHKGRSGADLFNYFCSRAALVPPDFFFLFFFIHRRRKHRKEQEEAGRKGRKFESMSRGIIRYFIERLSLSLSFSREHRALSVLDILYSDAYFVRGRRYLITGYQNAECGFNAVCGDLSFPPLPSLSLARSHQ